MSSFSRTSGRKNPSPLEVDGPARFPLKKTSAAPERFSLTSNWDDSHTRHNPQVSLDKQVVDLVADFGRPTDNTFMSKQSPAIAYDQSSNDRLERASEKSYRVGDTYILPIVDMPASMLEKLEERDAVSGLRDTSTPHARRGHDNGLHRSVSSVLQQNNGQHLGLSYTGAKLASLYLVSGLGKSTTQWSLADSDSTRGVQPLEDSIGLFWRPDMLGSSFSGEGIHEAVKGSRRSRKDSRTSTRTNGLSRDLRWRQVADAGPTGAQALVSKAMKFAHPRDVEVINSTLAPPTTCHAFTFAIPCHDTLSAIARTRLNSQVSRSVDGGTPLVVGEQGAHGPAKASLSEVQQVAGSASQLTFHGVTLTVWTHADKERAVQLKTIKTRSERAKMSKTSQGSIGYATQARSSQESGRKAKKRSTLGSLGRLMGAGMDSATDFAASETETGMSDSDLDGGGFGRSNRRSTVGSVPEDAVAAYEEASDVFWMPYAITLVSRYPIYDLLQDFLRLSWARYSKDAKVHLSQIHRVLNYDCPRPGEIVKLAVGEAPDDRVTIEGHMPGGLMDFDKGLTKVDFQLWPLFQAVELDHILTCTEVAMSASGRVVFCSRHPAMLNVAVNTLKYIVDLAGWDGIIVPMLHARDATFLTEDPGPYIVGVSTETKSLAMPPSEAVLVDLDTNTLTCESLPGGVITPRNKREKVRNRLYAALGAQYPMDRTIPIEFKVSYPRGSFRNFHRVLYKGQRPHYLGERLKPPPWWHHEAIMAVFDKMLAERHKKPSLIQRMMRTGMARSEVQLSAGEQLAKAMMRRRALHYVETRDDLELKVAKIDRRLLKLVQEGEHWRKQFELFEKYADKLTLEANELKIKIDRERKEAKRLSSLATEQTKHNVELEDKLKNTEDARAEAMRQLSDMHQSIQELEREREDLMDTFEAQVNGALAGMSGLSFSSVDADGAFSRWTRLGHADTASVHSSSHAHSKEPSDLSLGMNSGSRRRSSTVNSGLSSAPPTSVLGRANATHLPGSADQRRQNRLSTQSHSIAETGGSVSYRGKDGMSERVVSIQAKLELALGFVSAQRLSSVDLQVDEDAEPADRSVSEGLPADPGLPAAPPLRKPSKVDLVSKVGADVSPDVAFEDATTASAEGITAEEGDLNTPTASRRPSRADLLRDLEISSDGSVPSDPSIQGSYSGLNAGIPNNRPMPAHDTLEFDHSQHRQQTPLTGDGSPRLSRPPSRAQLRTLANGIPLVSSRPPVTRYNIAESIALDKPHAQERAHKGRRWSQSTAMSSSGPGELDHYEQQAMDRRMSKASAMTFGRA
ncbi:hypothetical protein IAU60_001758 [Kwoniella sp. DSM 27419]